MSDVTLLYYYRSQDPKFPAAQKQDHTEGKHVEEIATAFAARFGAQPLYVGMVVPHFGGVGFPQGKRPAVPQLWVNPKRKDPRMAPKRANVPPRLVAQAKALCAEWDDNYPHEIAKERTCHLLEALGFTQDQVPGNTLQFFVNKDVSWIATSIPLDSYEWEEVTASLYDAARREHRALMEMKAMAVNDSIATAVAANEEKDNG